MITWWNDKSIEVIEIDDKYIALNGWNGEFYTDCFEVCDIVNNVAHGLVNDKVLCAKPIYKEISEDDFDLIGYEII